MLRLFSKIAIIASLVLAFIALVIIIYGLVSDAKKYLGFFFFFMNAMLYLGVGVGLLLGGVTGNVIADKAEGKQ